jgi:hypothetical protein
LIENVLQHDFSIYIFIYGKRIPPYGIGCCLKTVSLARYFSPYTLTNHKGRCMSHVINMHRLGDSRQTAINDLSKVTPCLVTPRFKHSALVVRAKQHNYSAVAAVFMDPWFSIQILSERYKNALPSRFKMVHKNIIAVHQK